MYWSHMRYATNPLIRIPTAPHACWTSDSGSCTPRWGKNRSPVVQGTQLDWRWAVGWCWIRLWGFITRTSRLSSGSAWAHCRQWSWEWDGNLGLAFLRYLDQGCWLTNTWVSLVVPSLVAWRLALRCSHFSNESSCSISTSRVRARSASTPLSGPPSDSIYSFPRLLSQRMSCLLRLKTQGSEWLRLDGEGRETRDDRP